MHALLCEFRIDIIRDLQIYGVEVHVTDPQATSEEAQHGYGVPLTPWAKLPRADAIVAAVAHREFTALSPEDFASKLVKGGAFINVKAVFSQRALEAAGYRLWRLSATMTSRLPECASWRSIQLVGVFSYVSHLDQGYAWSPPRLP
jgi:hypothetical protein